MFKNDIWYILKLTAVLSTFKRFNKNNFIWLKLKILKIACINSSFYSLEWMCF